MTSSESPNFNALVTPAPSHTHKKKGDQGTTEPAKNLHLNGQAEAAGRQCGDLRY